MTDPAASDAEPTAPFGARDVPKSAKSGLVRGVFDSVAGKYDLMNDAMSLGVHRVWKDIAITRANPQPGELLIDVAGGTGDLSRLWVRKGAAVAKRRGGAPSRAIVCDINEEMVRAGARKADPSIARSVGNAEDLPFTEGAAHAVTIGFGIRNVTDRAAALKEMRRVLKPGGRLVCLEFSRPTFGALERVYDAWSFNAIPRLGSLIAGDRESYEYLVESIRRFPDQEAFAAEVEAAGFKRVSVTNLSGGVAALHVGWRT